MWGMWSGGWGVGGGECWVQGVWRVGCCVQGLGCGVGRGQYSDCVCAAGCTIAVVDDEHSATDDALPILAPDSAAPTSRTARQNGLRR